MVGCTEQGKCSEHEHRISNLEKQITEVELMVKNPATTIALIHAFGAMFTGFMAFLGVILAPALRAWLGV